MLSLVRLSRVIAGGSVSTVTTRDASALLPLTFVTLTLTCARPSIRVSMALAGTVRLQEPSCCTWAVKVWSANFTTTVCPASTPCVFPERVKSAPFSAAFSRSSPETVSMVTATALRSSSIGCSAATVLPQASFALTLTVTSPAVQACRSVAGTPMLQPPLAVTTALYSTLLMVTTIGVPAARWVLAPVTVRSCCCSMALTTSSPEMVFTRRPGSCALMLISRSPVPVLPCELVTDAVKVKSPSPNALRSADGIFTLQVRSLPTVAVKLLPPTVTETVSPAAAPVTRPLRV